MIDKLKQIIISKQTQNNNSCGTTILYLMSELEMSSSDIKPLLKQLHTEKVIIFKKGINHDLLFLKSFSKKR